MSYVPSRGHTNSADRRVTSAAITPASFVMRARHRARTRRAVDVLGEANGNLFVNPSLPAGSRVVTEGRAIAHH